MSWTVAPIVTVVADSWVEMDGVSWATRIGSVLHPVEAAVLLASPE